MTTRVDHIAGTTWHGRRDGPRNAFRYSIDYLLLDAEGTPRAPALFSRNGRTPMAVHDSDHGGLPHKGRGAAWVRSVLDRQGLPSPVRIELLAQPRILGHVFNPVSFWLCRDERDRLFAVIAEVSNTFGDRHSYLCHHDDLREITGSEELEAAKIFHVSPFQPVEGRYIFRFDVSDAAIDIRIDYRRGNGGLVATLAGPRRPLTNRGILGAMLRRPFGSRRVLALIHWQALKLWWKGAGYRPRPEPPEAEVSR